MLCAYEEKSSDPRTHVICQCPQNTCDPDSEGSDTLESPLYMLRHVCMHTLTKTHTKNINCFLKSNDSIHVFSYSFWVLKTRKNEKYFHKWLNCVQTQPLWTFPWNHNLSDTIDNSIIYWIVLKQPHQNFSIITYSSLFAKFCPYNPCFRKCN